MKRLTAGILSAVVLSAGIAVMAPAASADRCDHGHGHYVRYYRGGWGGYGWRGYRGGRWCDDDHHGPSIGTLLLGAGAAYGAYRIYDDYRSRQDHHHNDDDD